MIPKLLAKVETELLLVLIGLGSTQDDVVALRGSVERLATVLEDVGARLAAIPGADLLKRRAKNDR